MLFTFNMLCYVMLCLTHFILYFLFDQVTAASELVQSSPEYVIKYTNEVTHSADSYAWGALAALSSSQVGIFTAATNGKCSGDAAV
jgi:hypothetical protein